MAKLFAIAGERFFIGTAPIEEPDGDAIADDLIKVAGLGRSKQGVTVEPSQS